MNTEHIERITRRGAHTLRDGLWEFWPGNGSNEMSERNLSLHVAQAFMAEGFSSYQEVRLESGTNERLDMMLWHPRRRVLVACEAKRLYSSEKAAEINRDVGRIQRFSPEGLTKPKERYGLILACTWNRSYAHWWSSDESEAPGSSWEELGNLPALANAHWGSVVLQGFDDASAIDGKFQYLLYCAFPIDR